MKRILSLCDYTGIWSQPYREAGYDIIQVDVLHGSDVRLLEFPGQVHGIIAQPPCTHFASSGARWWKQKGDAALLEGLQIVDACLRFVAVCAPVWWVLENPIGRLRSYLGAPAMYYNPHEYAGLADDPYNESYTKKTALWGVFTNPASLFSGQSGVAREPVLGSKMHKMSSSWAQQRSVTPQGFARAFYKANP